MSKFDPTCLPADRRDGPWLTIIGMGEDGLAGLSETAKAELARADIVFGGARHLALADAGIVGERHPWLSPFERSVEAVIAERGRSVAVLASGDPFLFGVGATLARRIPIEDMRIYPAPSSFSLAASRLGWPLADTICLSLHGRPIDLIRPHLHPDARILALTSDEKGPSDIARLLCEAGFGASVLTILEALGGEHERVSRHTAATFAVTKTDPLNICAVEVVSSAAARIIPYTPGLDDSLFEHDGQITKREVRALTLAALAPRRGELLWDIGAGAGSVAIEWLLADPSLKAIAVECDPQRVARILRNARGLGVPTLTVVEGKVPLVLADLPQPDVIFIGGGGTEPGTMDMALTRLKPGGRLVANAVTTEMEAVLLSCHARLGGSLTRIDIARAAPVGTMSGWRPAMPVTQWTWVCPTDETRGDE